MRTYILNRLDEPSTWRGLCDFATAVGVVLNPDQIAAIVSGGIALRALIGTFLPDQLRGPKQPENEQ